MTFFLFYSLNEVNYSDWFVFVFVLAVPHDMWGLSFPTRDRTHAPCSGSTES